MADFYAQFDKVERAAFHYGSNAVTLRTKPGEPFVDQAHYRKFISACHRGFSIAQNTVLEMLMANAADLTLSNEEKERRELLLRKVIDGILYTMVRMQTWITRRIVLHDEPPALNFTAIAQAKKLVDEMNAQDRMTFGPSWGQLLALISAKTRPEKRRKGLTTVERFAGRNYPVSSLN